MMMKNYENFTYETLLKACHVHHHINVYVFDHVNDLQISTWSQPTKNDQIIPDFCFVTIWMNHDWWTQKEEDIQVVYLSQRQATVVQK